MTKIKLGPQIFAQHSDSKLLKNLFSFSPVECVYTDGWTDEAILMGVTDGCIRLCRSRS
jgi:hypothetical protein